MVTNFWPPIVAVTVAPGMGWLADLTVAALGIQPSTGGE